MLFLIYPTDALPNAELSPEKKIHQYMLDGRTIENRLSTSTILSATKTRNGYLGFATYNSLIRFDGTSYKRFNSNNCDGIACHEGPALDVIQKSPFYETLAFQIVVLFGLGLLIVGYHLERSRKLKMINRKLAALVKQRTASIEEQKRELEQLNAIKNKFLSVISHDLRSPLNSLKGLLDLLGAGALSQEEFIEHSKNLDEQINNLTNLMDNLLTWSQSQMQRIALKRESVDLYSVVEGNLTLFRAIAQKKDIALENNVSKHIKAFTDSDMLHLVLRNLIANAIKFTHAGGVVRVSSNRNHEGLEVSVSDTGVGMSKEQQEKLFNLNIHNSKRGTADEIGTGLGLNLCKEFIEMSGEKIWVESVPGQGSTFKFTLEEY